MPNPILSDKNRGKSFADISKSIQSKYEDRFDPISQRGLMAEMNTLKEEQEYKRAKEQIKEMLKQQLNPQQQSPEQFNPMGQDQMLPINNQGIVPEIPMDQPQGQFSREASSSYNQQFGNGGSIKYNNGGFANEKPQLNIQVPNIDITPSFNQAIQFPTNQVADTMDVQGATQNNPMRYAPIAANIYSMFSTKRPVSNMTRMQNMGYQTSVDPSLATRVQPRQTQFNNIDFNPIERGIQDQARGFTANNINVSGGDAGAFRANELANTSNIMKAISNARLQQGQFNQQTQAMNAQEQARVDQFRQGQAGVEAGIRSNNIQTGMQLADLDARDLGAFNNMRNANITGLATNLGNIARESDQMKMISNALGYNSFGEYINSLPKEERGKATSKFMEMISKIGR